MKYAIIKFNNDLGWARILKQNKDGSVRVKLFGNWNETISKNNVFDIVDADMAEKRLVELKVQHERN